VNFYNQIITLLNEHNQSIKNVSRALEIDTISIFFDKRYKLERLNKLGFWHKIKRDNTLYPKLEKRLTAKQITSAFKLEEYPIYYTNQPDYPKYNKAILVMFGLSQYHKSAPPTNLIEQIIKILKNISSIDICYDFDQKPNIDRLKEYYKVTQYQDTYYINNTYELMIEKICIYDKSNKNGLNFNVYRFEATINTKPYSLKSTAL